MDQRNDETRLAEQIVSVLPEGVVRACSPEKDSIRFSVRAGGMKLRTIVLSRRSLRKLLKDAARDIKVEYLQRDLLANVDRRSEFRYPRLSGLFASASGRRTFPLGFPIASVM